MKRTTIFAEEEILEDFKRIAREKEISLAETIRQAMEDFINRQDKPRKQPSFLGFGRSGHKDIAERHETLLWKINRKEKRET